MDLHPIDAAPTPEERAAIDLVLGLATSGWEGGVRRPELDGHVAYGGTEQAQLGAHLHQRDPHGERALGVEGKSFTLTAGKLLAICIQHEMDHLEGKVFVDYLSRLKQQRIKAKLQKQLRKTA